MHRNPDALGIYVHFPYCIHKCRYCDFFSVGMDTLGGGKVPHDSDLEAFALGIVREFETRTAGSGPFARYRDVNSVYFGGGTASLLSADVVGRLLELFRSRFRITEVCEVTLEGNPENFTDEYLSQLSGLGITRVNAGVQTFEPKHLARVGRYYDQDRYSTIMEALSRSSIPTVGVDLMYGFPEQTAEEFRRDLARVLEHRIDHLSVYSLTAEPGTPFAADIDLGRESGPEEGLQEVIFRELPGLLRQSGFAQYEVSNFARPGHECRHNLRYWLYEPYLGLGPGAHGFTGTERYANARHVARWQAAPAAAATEAHRPQTDIPLNVLRLTQPFPLDLPDELVFEATGGSGRRVRPFLENLVRTGAGRLTDTGAFQWTLRGLLQLDQHVLALSELLSSPDQKSETLPQGSAQSAIATT